MVRLRLLALVWFLLLAVLPAARAEDGDEADAAARELDRAALLREAERKVGALPDRQGKGAIRSLQRELAADIQFLMHYEPKTPEEKQLLEQFERMVQERILLLGQPPTGEGESALPGTMGAVQEARLLYGWLVGEVPCHVWIAEAGKPFEKGRHYLYPPEPKPEPTAEKATADAEEGELGAAPSGPPPAEAGDEEVSPKKDGASDAEGAAGAKEPTEAAAPEPEPKPAPKPPPSAKRWAGDIVLPAENGTLLGKAMAPAKCGTAESLELAAGSAPAYMREDVSGLQRHALLSADVFAYNRPYAALRHLQADQRNRAMQADQPPTTFISDAMVAEKNEAVRRYKEDLVLRQKQRADVIAQLDQMVSAVDAWKEQGALLLQEIEEFKARIQPKRPEPVEPAEGGESPEDGASPEEGEAEEEPVAPPVAPPVDPVLSLKLRVAQTRESLTNLELTLIYLTAVRAKARIKLLDTLVRAAEEETTAAVQTRTRYEGRLTELRNERRMDRLQSAERRLRRWAKSVEGAAEGTIRAKELAAYEALIEVHEVVEKAVATRQSVTSPGHGEEEEKEPVRVVPAVEVADPRPSPATESTAPGTEPARHVSKIIRDPASATWDVKYVQIATRELEDPELTGEFGADLIASHYAQVDNQIRGLLTSMDSAGEDARLQPLFLAAVAKAEAALEPLADDPVTNEDGRNLPELLRAAMDDYKAAKDGLLEERRQNQERLQALLDYRRLLRAQGTRSLLIRTDRDLADADVRGVVNDASDALARATRWMTATGDDHAGLWLQRAWVRLLLALLLIVAVVFLVRRGRVILDRRIEVAAAANPDLQGRGASVLDEKLKAKQRRAEEEEAKVEVSAEDVLRQVTPEAAAVSAPPSSDEDEERDADTDAEEADETEKEDRR